MNIDLSAINTVATLIGSLTVIAGVLFAGYRFVDRDKRQSKLIHSIQQEQVLIVYGMQACLAGLVEIGADGPVKEAREKLDKHLNQRAHDSELEGA